MGLGYRGEGVAGVPGVTFGVRKGGVLKRAYFIALIMNEQKERETIGSLITAHDDYKYRH